EEDRLRLHHEIPEKGLAAVLGTEPIFPIAQELVDLSCASLSKQKTKDEKRDECRFLCDIRQKIIKTKKSPAEILLDLWEGDFARQPSRLIDYLSIH
ncbi:MAG: hypothetical protein PHS88_12205, partial [Candidatus Omnitrophica bacterium]|nr:hypothetical protein [Candidatus Omnitrophota bacterium]